MSNIQVQLRRGTTSQHNSFAGAVGEVTVDTDLDTLRVHDGSTNGGVRLAKHSELAGAGGGGTVTSVDSGTGLTGGPITTSGTLSISSGGVGTTQLANDAVTSAKIANNAVGSSEIADDAVTFAKMTNISTATVIGRTSANTGNPELVAIKDEDNMASNSATALATQQSIKAYVDTQVAASTVSKYSTGWVNTDGTTSVANAALLTFTHNLGTTDFSVTVYAGDDSSGTNPFLISPTDSITGASRGAQVNAISTTQVSLRLGANGFLALNSSGVNTGVSWASKYIKVVAIG